MTSKIRTLIVDDESLARRGLTVRLQEFPQVELLDECQNARQALEKILELKPDLVFLDIQMPGMNGFELLREVKAKGASLPVVVFVTAYDQYAIKAFEVRAIDYLLKPVDHDRLAQTLTRVEKNLAEREREQQQQRMLNLLADATGEDCEAILRKLADNQDLGNVRYPEHIAIKESGEITRVAINSIEWVDAAGDYMCIHAGNETHILRRTMKELEDELNPNRFQRIHRSAIVNLEQIEKLCSRQNGEYHIVLKNGKELKVSRSYKERIKRLILTT
ncbi:LytR/AlgR family response regulator transcription factor [Pseudidiomarina terrestris]|uniref:Response regulator transcription factor n=1 Tax=Pseudidiomarina terrestris TaxID=2820060 RepID=A0AAW7QXA6_9GAMM|nr:MULTISPECIES: LytTR family DNA-binding domain-containing protein [unclassified Pseudidiomarina]MDN7123713.1 response regulator transcription factor [Pseudidiomarina sp. 1APP75-32.1]MDN7126497.1 response regulator transcription factor [Pseudidiomarina sp. 1APR75-33.1]MDN7128563.1 response regulator transcription factor [Pseudidiomarina sp. 1APR75-15]MDN7135179.1 response regulator transcription factor [Pseudidiomarina sp. 1ASP75-5]MDN7137848.1 response regulator transcription factor [Pseudid